MGRPAFTARSWVIRSSRCPCGTGCALYAASTMVSENQYAEKLRMQARTKAMIIPFFPAMSFPTKMKSAVRKKSRRNVVNMGTSGIIIAPGGNGPAPVKTTSTPCLRFCQ